MKLPQSHINALTVCEQYTGQRFPQYEKVAPEIGVSSRQHVHDIIKRLRNKGLIDDENQITTDGRRALVLSSMQNEAPVTRSAPSHG